MTRTVITLLILTLAFGSALAAAPQAPGKKDRCPVCGMFVAPYPEWIATIVLKDGSQIFFDGSKDLFRYYFSMSAGQAEQVDSIHVTEYYSTRMMKVDEVYFVLGSDVYGPMGRELVPVAGADAARTFLRDHQGSEILTFDQVSPAKLPAD